MRTFHTGGVAGADITHGLPRVVEIFEARSPKGAAKLAEVGGRVEIEQTERGPKVLIYDAGRRGADELPAPAPHAAAGRERAGDRAGRRPPRGLADTGRPPSPQGLDGDGALPRHRGAARLQVTGRRDPRQAHRADRPADAEEGARRDARRHRAPARAARRQGRAREGERPRQEGEGRAGDVRASDPRDHQGVARHGVVPVGRIVPGDDEGAHGRCDRGQGRQAARPEGERDHREADPGRDGPQAVPERRDQAVREGAAVGLPPARVRGAAACCAAGDRGGRRRRRVAPRPRTSTSAERSSRTATSATLEAGEAVENPEIKSPLDEDNA